MSWSIVATPADNSDEDIYNKVLSAAIERDDQDMVLRLHGVLNGDLVAMNARYHQKKKCLWNYLAKKEATPKNSDIMMSIELLIQELHTLIIKEKNVFLLTSLRNRLLEIANEEDILLESYRTQLLKSKLSQMRFVLRMYGSKDLGSSLNKVCCSMASSHKSKVPGKKLPPTEDSFLLHMQRSAFQLMIWKSADIGVQELPNPTENGWQLDQESGRLMAKPMSQGCSAPELLNDLICACFNECSNSCVCVSHKQPCVPACGCYGAKNIDSCLNLSSVLQDDKCIIISKLMKWI